MSRPKRATGSASRNSRQISTRQTPAPTSRAARARAELDRFVEELARVTGFAGRTRTFTDEAERARVSVHKAVRRSLTMITDAEPVIGQVLGACVLTGLRCVYRSCVADAAPPAHVDTVSARTSRMA